MILSVRFHHPLAAEEVSLQPVQQPFAQRAFKLLVPRLGVPAALVFGLLDEADGRVLGDAAEAALDQLPIRGGPMARDFRDGRRAVPFKPGALRFARSHAPRQHDLEGAFAEFQRRDLHCR